MVCNDHWAFCSIDFGYLNKRHPKSSVFSWFFITAENATFGETSGCYQCQEIEKTNGKEVSFKVSFPQWCSLPPSNSKRLNIKMAAIPLAAQIFSTARWCYHVSNSFSHCQTNYVSCFWRCIVEAAWIPIELWMILPVKPIYKELPIASRGVCSTLRPSSGCPKEDVLVDCMAPSGRRTDVVTGRPSITCAHFFGIFQIETNMTQNIGHMEMMGEHKKFLIL